MSVVFLPLASKPRALGIAYQTHNTPTTENKPIYQAEKKITKLSQKSNL